MTLHLIVTADDCGLSEGINQTAVRLHREGVLTDASLMSNFPAAKHALDLFREHPSLEVGIHLNLSDGFPLTKIPPSSDLVRADGHFRDRVILLARALLPPAAMLDQAKAEMRAQIEFVLAAGIRPAHLTTHHHFHALPAMRDLVYSLAEEYGVTWVRATDYRATSVPGNLLLDRETRRSGEQSFVVPDYVVVLKNWVDKPAPETINELLSLRGTVELVVHPCTRIDATFPGDVRYRPYQRSREAVYVGQLYRTLRHRHPDVVIGRLSHPTQP